jgi:hypothetical protein
VYLQDVASIIVRCASTIHPNAMTSDSAASWPIVDDSKQSSDLDVPSLFLIVRTRLRVRSAELLVTASDAKIRDPGRTFWTEN